MIYQTSHNNCFQRTPNRANARSGAAEAERYAQSKMKLLCGNIIAGELRNTVCDLYREDGEFILNNQLVKDGDETEKQLHEWIVSKSKLEEYDCELSDEEYENHAEIEALWESIEKLPKFEKYKWFLQYDNDGQCDEISSVNFGYNRAFWYILKRDHNQNYEKKNSVSTKLSAKEIAIAIVVGLLILWAIIYYSSGA